MTRVITLYIIQMYTNYQKQIDELSDVGVTLLSRRIFFRIEAKGAKGAGDWRDWWRGSSHEDNGQSPLAIY